MLGFGCSAGSVALVLCMGCIPLGDGSIAGTIGSGTIGNHGHSTLVDGATLGDGTTELLGSVAPRTEQLKKLDKG